MIHDDDGHLYPEPGRDPVQKTEQDVILHREWARKRAMEILSKTSLGKDLVKILRRKGIPTGEFRRSE